MTQPSAEKTALTHLARQGYETFAPKFREVVTERGRRVSRSGFLFSRYVFVWVVDQWRSINGTRGVQKLFMIDERPAFLNFEDEARISELRARIGSNGWIDLNADAGPKRKIGDEVSVVGGPFYGFKGIWQGQTKEEREVVLLNMLGRAVRVELDHAQVA